MTHYHRLPAGLLLPQTIAPTGHFGGGWIDFRRVFPVVLLLLSLTKLAAGQAPAWQWAAAPAPGQFPFPAPTGATIAAAAPDGAGNTVVAGSFSGTITLGTHTITSVGDRDLFVARLDAAGIWTQAMRAGSADTDIAEALAVAPDGTAIVVGAFYSSRVTFGSTTLVNANPNRESNIFVARLSPAGTWTQAVRAGGLGVHVATAVAVDARGAVTVGGLFAGPTSTFGSTTLTNAAPAGRIPDGFVARLSRAGAWQWAVRMGSPRDDQVTALALDGRGVALVGGYFSGPTASFGSRTLTNTAPGATPPEDLFVARFDTSGTCVQAVRAGGRGGEVISALAADPAGEVLVAGTAASDTLRFGALTVARVAPAPGNLDVFVARLSAADVWTQAAVADGDGYDQAQAVAFGPGGTAWVAGYFGSTSIRFGATTLTNAATPPSFITADVFVAQLGPTGTWTQATRGGGGINEDKATAVFADAAGNVTVAGVFGNPGASFGSTTLTSFFDYSSCFVARLTPAPTAIPSLRPTDAFSLAPNPAHGLVRLHWPTASRAKAPTEVLLLDALGRVVRKLPRSGPSPEALLDLSGLPPGNYMVRCDGATARLVVE